jgi:hypothetical protein
VEYDSDQTNIVKLILFSGANKVRISFLDLKAQYETIKWWLYDEYTIYHSGGY